MGALNSSGQPPRTYRDGPVAINRKDDGTWSIRVTHEGVERELIVGGYNAFRLLAMLAMMLADGGSWLLSKKAARIEVASEPCASVSIDAVGNVRMKLGGEP